MIVSDGMWCTIFPTIPCLIRHVGEYDRTYIGYTAGDGTIRVAQMDHDTGDVDDFHLADAAHINDHNSATVFILADGRILVMWSYHTTTGDGYGGNGSIRYRVTSEPEDLSTLGPVQNINHGTRCAYSQVYQTSTGRVGVWSRVGSSTSSETWVVSYTEDLNTWTTETVWNPVPNRMYTLLRRREGGGFWLGLHTHPQRGGDQSIRYVRFDEETGDVIHDVTGAVMGNAYTGANLPLNFSNAPALYPAQSNDHTRLHDINVWGDALVGVWGDSPEGGDYIVTRRQSDGSYVNEVVAPTGAFAHQGNGYVGDATFSFEDRNRLWISSEEGGVWQVYQYSRVGGVWQNEGIVSSRTSPALRFRPRAVENAHPDFVVGWVEVERYDGLADWSGSEIWGAQAIEDQPTTADLTFRAAQAAQPLTFAAAGEPDPDPEPPATAPTVTLIPVNQTQINLSLSSVTGATGYRYRVGTSGAWTDLGSSRTAQITGLSPGTEYTVQARAYNEAGDGPIGSATASTLEPEVNAPPVFQTSPPTSVRAGQTYVYNGVVTDADGDPITITLEEGPDWLELTDHGDGTFTLEGTAPSE